MVKFIREKGFRCMVARSIVLAVLAVYRKVVRSRPQPRRPVATKPGIIARWSRLSDFFTLFYRK